MHSANLPMSEKETEVIQPTEDEQQQQLENEQQQLESDQRDAVKIEEETKEQHSVGSTVVCSETAMLDEKLSICTSRVACQTSTLGESEGMAETVTLKHIYSIFCWLHCQHNNRMWRESPLSACQKAVTDCRFMADANPEKLRAKLDEIRNIHAEIIEKYGSADKVPKDLRVVPGGPLFSIVNFVFTGQCLQAKGEDCVKFVSNSATSGSSLAENAQHESVSATASQQRSLGGGPVRHGRAHSQLSRDHPLVRKAVSLTPDDVKQMVHEMTIRKAIALRDAKLLADWTAMRRRELEVKEMRLRQHIGTSTSSRIEELLEFNDFLKKYAQ
ncbi:hypothetical protein DL89DRAFT_270462 [Linderina pennispora]|uniref:Uncharacterized protein n=1 Tax=Linderina pennispora TaxID=61395 RepID=A0A1Y1VX77_9FUNG|nr:uncharacterized protein DL89DRAFT_270462 [Linderina pennispora]ORX65899.1 hypothetical protein DL89DRAFT_270462 [Linderina pennispora]